MQDSGAPWASSGEIREGKKVVGRRWRAQLRPRQGGCRALPGEVPALEAAFAPAQTAPSLAEGGGGGSSGSGLGAGGAAGSPCASPGSAIPPLPLRFPGGTGGLLLTRYCLLSPLAGALLVGFGVFLGPYFQSKRETLRWRSPFCCRGPGKAAGAGPGGLRGDRALPRGLPAGHRPAL